MLWGKPGRKEVNMEEKKVKKVKVILHGCNGKMGRVITELAKKDDKVQIVAGIDPYTGVEN